MDNRAQPSSANPVSLLILRGPHLNIYLYRHHVTAAIVSYNLLRNYTGSIPTILNDDVLVVTVYQGMNNTDNDTVNNI